MLLTLELGVYDDPPLLATLTHLHKDTQRAGGHDEGNEGNESDESDEGTARATQATAVEGRE